MNLRPSSPRIWAAVTATVVLLTGNHALAQNMRVPEIRTASASVLPVTAAGRNVLITRGHSKLFYSDRPFGTIIVGDDSIAGTAIGAGNSFVITGLAPGTTNLIVLSETLEVLMETDIVVAPPPDPFKSYVTVSKGGSTSLRYECRGHDCVVMKPEDATRSLSFVLTQPAEEAAEGTSETSEN